MIRDNVDWQELPAEGVVRDGRRAVLPHRLVVGLCREAVTHGGFAAGAQQCWLSPDGKNLLAVTEVKADWGGRNERLCVALRSSQNKATAFRWYHGVLTAEGAGVVVRRSDEVRQTSEANVAKALERCVDVLAVDKTRYAADVKELKTIRFDERRWHEHMLDRVRKDRERDRVSWLRMARVDKLIRRRDAKTAWDVLTCFCLATAEGASPWNVRRFDQLYVFYEPLGALIAR